MVRFSCFNAHINSHRSKKIPVPCVEAMHKTLQDSSKIEAPVASLSSLYLNARVDAESTGTIKDAANSDFSLRGWKSDEIKGKLNIANDIPGVFKKSQSVGSGLCHEGTVLSNNEMEEIDHGFSSDSFDGNLLVGPDGAKNLEVIQNIPHDSVPWSESAQVDSDILQDKSFFSTGDPQHLEKESLENYKTSLSGENANVSCNQTTSSLHMIVKSSSLPNMRPFSVEHSHKYVIPRSRSCENLHVLRLKLKESEVSFHAVEMQQGQEQNGKDSVYKTEKVNCANSVDGYDSCNYSSSAKDWIIPVPDELIDGEQLQRESSIQQGDEGKDFKIKRIEDWVSDLQHCDPLEEINEQSFSNLSVDRDSTIVNGGQSTTRADNKVTPGMEAAKRYISSLGASATTAQLSNHGLTVIPFLSAFVSLRVLNLSGNSIVRITAGSFPRGLHMLNLSKNNISTIEGLRELSRLRVLDLSYNRIFRIGHGLASCSSLKELYLAGNKMSEVEGLHRLLKLTVLDLRFNKISTSKCLGQLAANYNSLQAISLEGNPAQKNVGDDQLKKYMQSLLPHLVYYNRQAIKLGTLKDAADRSVRLGINAHQSDRALRSDNKAVRKGSHGLSASRATSSSSHMRKNQGLVSPKQIRGRHARLPPAGTKAITNHSRLISLKSELSIRRSRSEGTLVAL